MLFRSGGTFPGLRIVPIDTSETNLPAAIGPSTNGLTIFGGRSIGGGSSIVQCNPREAFLRSFRPNGSRGGEIQTSPEASYMRTHRANGEIGGEIQTSPEVSLMQTSRVGGGVGGSFQTSPLQSIMRTYSGNGSESGWVRGRPQDVELAYVAPDNKYFSWIKADANEAFLYTRAGGTSRYLSVDANGIWAKQGSTAVSLVPEVRNFQYSSLWNADQSPAPIMVQHLPGGKLCQAQIRIQNLSGSSLSLPNETWVTLNYNPIPADLRGGYTDYIETTLPQSSARGRVEMNYSTGRIRIRNMSGADISWTNNNSIWFPMRWFSPN